jgi:hypothetical protein
VFDTFDSKGGGGGPPVYEMAIIGMIAVTSADTYKRVRGILASPEVEAVVIEK